MDISGKVVWITGASSGIGLALARELAQRGAAIALSARNLPALQALAKEICSLGGNAAAFECDVANENSISACADAIAAAFGRIDVAVANAGFGVVGKVEQLSGIEWQRQFEINVTGLALTAKYAMPHLRVSKGKMVLIGSVSAFFPGPGISAYAASKAAVRAIGQALLIELKKDGVQCLTIHPGFVESNITRIDNEGNYHPDRADPRPAKLMWPAGKAARVMADAIQNRSGDFVFTGHGRIAVWLAKYFPGVARKMSEKTMPEG